MLLLKIKPGLFASVTLPWTHLFLSQFTHLCGMCFCFLKKQLLYHPQLQVLLVDSSKPSRCSLGNNPILVQTDFGAKMLLSPWPWQTWECFLLPPHPRRFSSPTGTQLLPEEAAPGTQWTCLEFGLFPTCSQQALWCARCSPTMTQAAPGEPWEATAPWHWIFLDVSLTEQVKPSILNPASILSSWKIQIKTYLNCFKQLNMHYNCSVPPSNHEKCSLVGNKWSQNMDCSYANRVSFPLNFFFKRGIAKRTQLTAPLQN